MVARFSRCFSLKYFTRRSRDLEQHVNGESPMIPLVSRYLLVRHSHRSLRGGIATRKATGLVRYILKTDRESRNYRVTLFRNWFLHQCQRSMANPKHVDPYSMLFHIYEYMLISIHRCVATTNGEVVLIHLPNLRFRIEMNLKFCESQSCRTHDSTN